MADQENIHDDIKLFTTAEKFYLEPTIDPREILIIDRVTGQATVEPRDKVKIPIPSNVYQPVCGFLGTIKLISGFYLVVAKYRELVGRVNNHDIYRLAKADIIPYSRTNAHLTTKQIEDNATYEKLLRYALDTPGIYFSYGYDLTLSMQKLHNVPVDFQKLLQPMRADPRFLWNGYLLKDFHGQQFRNFALPLIQGFVSINKITIKRHQLTWALISRRCVERAGTRFFMRGVDNEGNVANYVETEQILELGGHKASFIGTRGSIPLYWTQYPDLKYKPAMTLSREDHVAAYTKHMRDQQQRYGSQVLLNLIDQRGKEESLERGYRAAVAAAALPGVRYEPFDFHAECRGMRYDRLNVLIERIAHEQEEFGYFVSRGGHVLLQQNGVFRTNCIDCLDRTNVVQSLLARRQLDAALQTFEVKLKQESLPSNVESLFNNVWADHADMISKQYSGTGALKTDFTRTGKRTRMGLINDGINSLTRYYMNNFSDGWRQDSYDLFLGKYKVQDGEGSALPSPLRKHYHWRYYTLPSVLLVAVSMFCVSAITPKAYDTRALSYIMMWGACVGATLALIFRYGTEFVDWPRLDAGGLATRRALPPPSL